VGDTHTLPQRDRKKEEKRKARWGLSSYVAVVFLPSRFVKEAKVRVGVLHTKTVHREETGGAFIKTHSN
jgi:hypothetical protein